MCHNRWRRRFVRGTALYTRTEVESWTGISRRTLRWWIAQGLVPRPLGWGRSAHYTDSHIRSIERVKRDLWDSRVTIADLRDRYNPEAE